MPSYTLSIHHQPYKLELVKSTKPRVTSTLQVKVALQTPTGRLIGNVTTDQIIFNVLRELKMEYPGPDQFPVVSFSGKECPLDKTLKQIGVLSGNVLFRYIIYRICAGYIISSINIWFLFQTESIK